MTREELSTMNAIQNMNRKIPDVELRDLFAMSVINGMSANIHLNDDTLEHLAELAYKQADAMLEARKK